MAVETVNVDEALFDVLAAFSEAANAVNAHWLIIGATARIMLLEKIYGWSPGVATQDIDFAVQIGDWEHYQLLCDYITKNDIYEAEQSRPKDLDLKKIWCLILFHTVGLKTRIKKFSSHRIMMM